MPGNGGFPRSEQAQWSSWCFPGSLPCFLVPVSQPVFGGLFTDAFNYMVNVTVHGSDT